MIRGANVKIDVWSDVACPFCYLGRETLKQALVEFEHADEVEVRFRSFQLNPEAPTEATQDVYDYLSAKYGITREQAISQNQQIVARGVELGIQFNMDQVQMTNTGSAHRLLHLALANGKQDELCGRLFKAYFTDGLNVADPEVLVQLATEVGLPLPTVTEVVEGTGFQNDVDADLNQARAYGITGVPFFVINEKYAISGAQPESVFAEALGKAWAESSPTR